MASDLSAVSCLECHLWAVAGLLFVTGPQKEKHTTGTLKLILPKAQSSFGLANVQRITKSRRNA
jgi:hypothetical protein